MINLLCFSWGGGRIILLCLEKAAILLSLEEAVQLKSRPGFNALQNTVPLIIVGSTFLIILSDELNNAKLQGCRCQMSSDVAASFDEQLSNRFSA